jgi:hypothetical protein
VRSSENKSEAGTQARARRVGTARLRHEPASQLPAVRRTGVSGPNGRRSMESLESDPRGGSRHVGDDRRGGPGSCDCVAWRAARGSAERDLREKISGKARVPEQ